MKVISLKLIQVIVIAILIFKVESIQEIDMWPLIQSLEVFVSKIMNKNIYSSIFEDENHDCLEHMMNALVYGKTNGFTMIFSGKSANDLGNKKECLNNNGRYILIDYRIDPNIYHKNSFLKDHSKFLYSLRFFTGFCIPIVCNNFANDVLNKSDDYNKVFYDYLDSIGIKRMKVVSSDYIDFSFTWKYDAFKLIGSFVSIYLLVLLIYTVISEIILIKLIKDEVEDLENEVELENLDESQESGSGMSSNIVQSTFQFASYVYRESKIKRLLVKLNTLFNLKLTVKLLFSHQNSYYNQSYLYFISCLRFLCLFCMTFQFTFETMLKMPQKDKGNTFLSSFGFVIVKFSSFFPFIFIVIEGINLGFKLMSYIKKNSNNIDHFSFGIKLYIKFIFLLVSRLLSFMIIFILFYVFIREIGYLTVSSDLLTYFQKIYYDSQKCFNNPLFAFVPFYFQYDTLDRVGVNRFSMNDSYLKFNSYQNYSCFMFVNAGLNLFLSIFIMCTLTYISIKLKNKAADIIFFAFIIFSNFFIYYNFKAIDSRNNFPSQANLGYVLGETLSLNHTHLFFPIFYFGFITGVMIFYHKDLVNNTSIYADFNEMSEIISNNKIKNNFSFSNSNEEFVFEKEKELETNNTQSKERYLPFIYCFYLMKFLNNLNSFIWKIIAFISVCGIIILSFYFKIRSSYEGYLSYQLNTIDYWIYCYEKKIFCVLINNLVLMTYLNDGDKIKVMNVWENKAFTFFERISFSYFCILESCTFMLFCLIDLDYRMSITNFVFFTFSSTMLCVFVSLIITLCFETPLRVLVKGFKKKEIN